jgi:hypothetical protein
VSGGGKNATSTQAVSIPPSVLAQYNSVNNQAQQTAQTPFQKYSGEFVAPVNSTQASGIAGTSVAANEAQPAFTSAMTGLNAAQSATAPVNADALGKTSAASSLNGAAVNNFLSPYLSDVLGSTEAIQNQENQQQQAGQLGTAISSGAFGGDRTGIAAANLAQQQQLANNQTIAGIANQGFNTALGAAQTEQGLGLQGAAQEAAIGQTAYGEGANTATQTAALGAGAQNAALQGAQAQIGAGTVEQQTQQAKDTALYNQFLQQQSYPFQVDQFLANIAEGTGALSGSTTTTTQPGGFFSDKRLKHDIKKVGKTYDGQEIYSYKMHGDPRTHIGLIAQKVEKKHPEAVGLAGGFKTVDYGKATEEAANRGHFAPGGVVPYSNAPDSLMGYSRNGPQKAHGEQNYRHIEKVHVKFPNGDSIVDGMSGINKAHAVERARRNWSGADITPLGKISSDEALNPSTFENRGHFAEGGTPGGVAGGRKPVTGTIAEAAHTDFMDGMPVNDVLNKWAAKGYHRDHVLAGIKEHMASIGQAKFASGGLVPRMAYAGGGPSIVDPSDLSAILQAQQQMYAPYSGGASGVYGGEGGTVPRGGSSRVPAPSGAHPSLVVAQGSPQPAPSGASNTSQAIGLGEKGYGLYKKFSGPSGGGVSPATQAAAVNEGPAAPAAGVAPVAPAADTAAAAEGPAADVGATTAADAAGTAAAGAGDAAIGAAAGDAAGAGAADAAAALAAEYAAADVAAAAVIAAKRGGRIGLGAGGSPYSGIAADDPYSSAGGSLDIPSDPNSYSLKTAGALKKVPTGFQDIMNMSNINNMGSMTGSMFSNTALARGGLAGSRHGFSEGGPPDDADPVMDPDMDSKPTAVPSNGGISGWWDRNKGNVLPILSGLAAAGTAKTVHPGVALAAGLEAAAGNYVPTQQGLASAAQTQATTKGIDIQNKIQQMKANAAKDYLAPTSANSLAAPQQAAQSIADQYRKKYFVQPGYTPDEQAAMQKAIKASIVLGDAPVKSIQQAHENRVLSSTAANQNQAQDEADQLYQTATQSADPAARQSALVQYNALHQWTGDKYADQAGLLRNSRTGQPPIGIAAQSLTPMQAFETWRTLAGPTDTGAPARIPFTTWAKENGINIPQGWIAPGTDLGAAPTTAPAATAPSAPAANAAPPGSAPTARAARPTSVTATPPVDFGSSPSKPSWLTDPHHIMTDEEKPIASGYAAAENSLREEANGLRETQMQQVAVQRMLNQLPNAKLGPGTQDLASVQKVLGNLTGSQFTSWVDSNPAAYDILAKGLGNQALDTTLSKLRSEGAQVRLGQGESNLILNKLSASPEMAKSAVQSLLNWQNQQLSYEADRQNAIPSYLAQGKDARVFNHEYAQIRPLQSAVSTDAPPATSLRRPGQTSAPVTATGPKGERYVLDPVENKWVLK